MATRRFEFSDGSSDKFWEISVEDTSFTVTYGRRGTAGQTSSKSFDTAEKAQSAADKLIAEKTKKGYTEVSGGVGDAKAAEKSAARAESTDPLDAPYDVTLKLENGKEKDFKNVKPGKPAAFPAHTILEVHLDDLPLERARRIIADVNSRNVPALGILVGDWRAANFVHGPLEALDDAKNLVSLHIMGGQYNDAQIVAICKKHPGLRVLCMSDTSALTDATLNAVAGLKDLQEFQSMFGAEFTDAGVKLLTALTQLDDIWLGNCNAATDASVDALLNGMPQIKKLHFLSEKFGKETKKRIEREMKERKKGKRVAALPEVKDPNDLSPAIQKELKRLGAKLGKPQSKYPDEAATWPASLRRLVFDVKWPKKTYTNGEDADQEVWMLEFTDAKSNNWKDHTADLYAEFPCCEGKTFITLGIADGGNYLLATALEDITPAEIADPPVYIIDHDSYEEEDLGDPESLSTFLASLSPEDGDKEDDEDDE